MNRPLLGKFGSFGERGTNANGLGRTNPQSTASLSPAELYYELITKETYIE